MMRKCHPCQGRQFLGIPPCEHLNFIRLPTGRDPLAKILDHMRLVRFLQPLNFEAGP